MNLLKFDYFNIEYTENNTYIYNPTFSQLDGLSTHHRPQDGSRGRRTRRKSRLKPRWSSFRSENNGKQQKIALYIALYDPLQARHRRKTHEISPWPSQIKMWKNVITSHFFESLLFSLKSSRPQKITISTS